MRWIATPPLVGRQANKGMHEAGMSGLVLKGKGIAAGRTAQSSRKGAENWCLLEAVQSYIWLVQKSLWSERCEAHFYIGLRRIDVNGTRGGSIATRTTGLNLQLPPRQSGLV